MGSTTGIGLGVVLFLLPLGYSIIDFVFFQVDLLNNPLVWVALGVATALGIAGGVNVVESGLNATGTKFTFISSLGVALYGLLIIPSLSNTGIPQPFLLWLQVAVSVSYALGLFLIMAES